MPGLPAPELHITSLCKKYGAFHALRDVSLQVHRGEILGLIGPNGAGKSTLMECIAGLSPMDGGAIRYRGRSLTDHRRKKHIWYLPDTLRPFADQRVGRTLAFFRNVLGSGEEMFSFLLDHLELRPVLDARFNTLSKGYARRVLLALALLSPRDVVMLDEPFDGLDPRRCLAVMALLRQQAGNRTMILSIHQLAEAEKICDRFLLLGQGRVIGLGSLEELHDQAGLTATASLEEVFLGLT